MKNITMRVLAAALVAMLVASLAVPVRAASRSDPTEDVVIINEHCDYGGWWIYFEPYCWW